MNATKVAPANVSINLSILVADRGSTGIAGEASSTSTVQRVWSLESKGRPFFLASSVEPVVWLGSFAVHAVA